MGMHIGLIAVKASVDQFRDAFTTAWPQLEVVDSVHSFPNDDAIWTWKESHEQFVSAADWRKDNPGKSVYLFWPNGAWAILLDGDYTLASDDDALQALSRHFGTALSFVVESAGGTAMFACLRRGTLARRITNADGDVEMEGEPLPEEAGINVSDYYMAETEALWAAFGLSPYEAMQSPVGCQAICVVDHTDYSSLKTQ